MKKQFLSNWNHKCEKIRTNHIFFWFPIFAWFLIFLRYFLIFFIFVFNSYVFHSRRKFHPMNRWSYSPTIECENSMKNSLIAHITHSYKQFVCLSFVIVHRVRINVHYKSCSKWRKSVLNKCYRQQISFCGAPLNTHQPTTNRLACTQKRCTHARNVSGWKLSDGRKRRCFAWMKICERKFVGKDSKKRRPNWKIRIAVPSHAKQPKIMKT